MDVYYPDDERWERITNNMALDGLAEKKKSPQAEQELMQIQMHESLPKTPELPQATPTLRPSKLNVDKEADQVWRA